MNEVIYHRFVALNDYVVECIDCQMMIMLEEVIEGELVESSEPLE